MKSQPKHSLTTAAVYDRWLSTLGGGEQVAFAYAEALRDLGYKTTLLTHQKVDIAEAEKKMNVNLKDINIRYLPNLLDYQLSEFTEDYDIFISNSFLDYIPNRSKIGLLSIFFPSKITVSWYEYLKRAHIVPSLRRFFIYPSQFEGFRYDSYQDGHLHKWLGKESSIYFNQNVSTIHITLFFEHLAFSTVDLMKFTFDGKAIEPQDRVINFRANSVRYIFSFPNESIHKPFTIHLPQTDFSDGVSLIKLSIPSLRYSLYNIFKSIFPVWEMRLHGGSSPTKYSDIESYDQIIAISKFTQHWIEKYWGMKSQILYPPVSTTNFTPARQKKNYILHVGRFFVGGHSKKQLELVRAFKQLVDKGITNWEFHLIGGIAEGSIHRQYVDKIREESENYPIFLHTDASFSELKRIMSEAKIYWHATGLDENEQKNPVQMEHFGITTVEAMASGCVPVVINKGGQPEIVTEKSGFIWNTREELLAYTQQLIDNQQLRKQMSQESIERSRFFDKKNFMERFKTIIINSEKNRK